MSCNNKDLNCLLKNYASNALTKEQIKLLTNVDKNIFKNTEDEIKKRKIWNKKYKIFKESERACQILVRQYYHFPSKQYKQKIIGKYKGLNVEEWIELQQIAYKNKELTEEQINLLEEVKTNIFSLL